MEDQGKILLVFDLDHTILHKNSDSEISALFKDPDDDSIYSDDDEQVFWGDIMQRVFLRLKNDGVKLEQVKALIQGLKLSKNFSDLFEFIRKKISRFDCIIISGANTLFIKWLIEKHKWEDIFLDYYANPAEPNEEKLISIRNYHSHNCESCDGSQCKSIVLNDYLTKKNNPYRNVIYLGDGGNDYCPSKLLKESDLLFPRKKYRLYEMLFKKQKIKNLKCKVIPWENGLEIIEAIKLNYFL